MGRGNPDGEPLKKKTMTRKHMKFSKKRAQEMEDEDLKQQLERNKDFIATQEGRGSKIFLTLENAKKGYHEIHKLQKGPTITLTDPAQQTTVIHQQITSDVHEFK